MLKPALIAFIFTFGSILTYSQVDSVSIDTTQLINGQSYVADSSHSPKKATLMSAIFPGLGQVYNDFNKPANRKSRLWWKLPLIYGGMGTGVYFIIENQTQYKKFKDERKALYDSPTGDIYSTSGYTNDQLKSITDQYSRWRDLSAVATLAVYMLNIIDANVEGTLIHFDTSDDLSLEVAPATGFVAHQSYTGFTIKLHF